MKYLYITPDAISHLITSRQYQSAEFLDCAPLIALLQGKSDSFDDGFVKTLSMKDGFILHAGKIKGGAGLFFDFQQYKTFQSERDNRIITIFQKILRYAIRYFGAHKKLAPCETVIDNKAVIFPFPYTQHGEAYRVVADRNTFRKGKTLNFLTIYYGGSEEITTPVSFSLLDRFYEEYKELNELSLPIIVEEVDAKDCLLDSYQVNTLESPNFHFGAGLTDQEWKSFLTKPQRDFVYKSIDGAERIEGAAGTGKTLSMVLKCIYNLKKSQYKKRFVFITHSLATKDHIIELFKQTCPGVTPHLSVEGSLAGSLLVTTVQEWCIQNLGSNIAETEYLDRDAMTSKGLQTLYIESAVSDVALNHLDLYRPILSREFLEFIINTDTQLMCEMLQYEFGVVLKGRADGDLEQYKKLTRPKYGIPCHKDADYNYVHLIFTAYQNQLVREGRFDSDDIVLTALSSLNAPIWRRRREIEGFDACFVDETHLFNFNELSVFPFLNKTSARNNIIFALDQSQFSGEVMQRAEDVLFMSSTDSAIKENIIPTTQSLTYRTIFRSSPSILNLAFNILSMGSTIFNNFDNPLIDAEMVDIDDDPRFFVPEYILSIDEDSMVAQTFIEVDRLQKEYHVTKSECLIVSTSDTLTEHLKKYCKQKNKTCSQLESRGDAASVRRAKRGNHYLIAGIDYVGGLEFDYVIIVGVDENRVPPHNTQKQNNFHFANYAWHRRIYVALTRARYGVLLIGNQSEGKAYMFENALLNSYLKLRS